jgi:predicted outer membrane repeat protein
MPAATAVVNTCRARNVTQDSAFDSNLQAVIRNAVGGDVIAVKFVCVGNFTIAKNLTLVGRPTAGLPWGVLNANGHGDVLAVPRAKVTLRNMKITGGDDPRWHFGAGITTAARLLQLKDTVVDGNTGTGIHNTGTLSLNGSSTVSHNTDAGIHNDGDIAPIGADVTLNGTSTITGNSGYGIYGYYSHITLNDSSSVSGNVTDVVTAVFSWEGELTLNDTASVANNIGSQAAIDNYSTFTINGSSSVSGNVTTVWRGGAIYNGTTGNVTMNDSSSVTGNSSVRSGGGIASDGVITMNGSSSISGNTADADDNGTGNGGGVWLACSATLTGGVDGGNVNHNYLGVASPVENNIGGPTSC